MNTFSNSENNGIYSYFYDTSSMIIRKMDFVELIHANKYGPLLGPNFSKIKISRIKSMSRHQVGTRMKNAGPQNDNSTRDRCVGQA